jgi:predicted transglutaminase-like cysteine proteinase
MRTKVACAVFTAAAQCLSIAAAIGGELPALAGDAARLERDQPFASTPVVGIPEGPLPDKWELALADIHSEIALLAGCRARPDQCSSPAAVRFLKIVERARLYQGFAKLAVINSGVNAAIERADIRQPGIGDPWPTALATFTSGRGVCIHFAIAKYTALRLEGWPSNDLRLVIVWPDGGSEPHMVLAARHNDRWHILDNTRSAVFIDTKLPNYVPLFVFDHLGARKLAPGRFPALSIISAMSVGVP